MPKFKIKKVSRFGYEGRDYFPGDIVELPKRFEGLDFLEPVKEPKKKPKKPRKKDSKA